MQKYKKIFVFTYDLKAKYTAEAQICYKNKRF